jgi:SAM-dependent methyltransferase
MESSLTERECYTRRRARHWDLQVPRRQPPCRRPYQRLLHRICRFVVPPGLRVLEVGCGQGNLLAAVEPAYGVGVDLSAEMVGAARRRHPHLHFIHADAHDLDLGQTFDVILLSDLINDLWDVQAVLERLRAHATPRTRFVLHFHSRLWQPVLGLARRLGLARATLPQNWLTTEDVVNLLHLSGLEPIRCWQELLWPLGTPLVEPLCNRFLVKLWPFRWLALTNFIVARLQPAAAPPGPEPSVSVIVPARNEAGNIPAIFDRLPRMGRQTELIFVEGHSRDDTRAVIERQMACHPEWQARLLVQQGIGKGDAVRQGFAAATGDVLMILDADLTVAPEDLPRFYEAIRTGRGEFINGVRLVYPMEDRAMRFLNFHGNKFFSVAFSWLLGQPIKDTLCGTKVLWRESYEQIAANRSYFGELDPFGDFDLIFGAAKQNFKLVDLPIRYRERVYGMTNIQRWRHGLLLLRMLLKAASRLKFT